MGQLELFSVEELHNNSFDHNQEEEKKENNKVEKVDPFGNEVRLEAYEGFFKILKIMKETYFASNFSTIFEFIWSLLKNSQERVQ